MFKCKPGHGIFTTIERTQLVVVKVRVKEIPMMAGLQPGNRCTVAGFDSPGTIKWVGKIPTVPGFQVGVALDRPVGTHSGVVLSRFNLFDCPAMCGISVAPEQIRLSNLASEVPRMASTRRSSNPTRTSGSFQLSASKTSISRSRSATVDSVRRPSARYEGPRQAPRLSSTDEIFSGFEDEEATDMAVAQPMSLNQDSTDPLPVPPTKPGYIPAVRRDSEPFYVNEVSFKVPDSNDTYKEDPLPEPPKQKSEYGFDADITSGVPPPLPPEEPHSTMLTIDVVNDLYGEDSGADAPAPIQIEVRNELYESFGFRSDNFDDLEDIDDTDATIRLGDIVNVIGYSCPGVIKWIGHLEVEKPPVLRCGLELSEPIGKNNGTVKVKYHSCLNIIYCRIHLLFMACNTWYAAHKSYLRRR